MTPAKAARPPFSFMDIAQSHFELFGLPARFAIDARALDAAYHALQSQVHPDRFASGSDAEKRVALQWATKANEAYRALRDPMRRAQYLLSLDGIEVGGETDTTMPHDFLVEQMQWREALDDALAARDRAHLNALSAKLAAQRAQLLEEIAQLFDRNAEKSATATAVRKLMFLEKFGEDVVRASDTLEASS